MVKGLGTFQKYLAVLFVLMFIGVCFFVKANQAEFHDYSW